MRLTDYHAKYYAHELTRRVAADSSERLAGALVDAKVDLNPHQVAAALFAFRSPLSKGALLADEVGLGKTIEAGLVISQRWAERKRRILVITPSNLRKQWHQELTEKFFLPCRIIEAKSYNEAIRQGHFRPLEAAEIVICSYQFAKSKAADVHATPWDLVVIDEAHRLRNVYKPTNVIANTLKGALQSAPKLLLTATPLQNSLLELFGLMSFVDEYAFGDLASFKAQFSNLTSDQVYETLRARLRPHCHRTLRRQVTAYVSYTRRHPLDKHEGTDMVTGSRSADMRSALVDYFREEGRIMIATEAGAEGINLQFCSLVVNYDLPWNPQRIEQRIGRCHRYGQKHDVVVVNFLNMKNEADQRVFRLLSEKFALFEGVFGASDEVLGALESGIDFEKRIARIYQQCRTPEQIRLSFDGLQAELSTEIEAAMSQTRRQLLEHFDEEVHEKLRINLRESQEHLNRYERLLMDLTRHELAAYGEFLEGTSAFRLTTRPTEVAHDVPLGLYELPRRSGEAHYYRLAHPLASWVIEQAAGRDVPAVELEFHYDGREARIAALEPFQGKAGSLLIKRLTVEALDRAEDHLLVAAVCDDGEPVEGETAKRLFYLPADVGGGVARSATGTLDTAIELQQTSLLQATSRRNAQFFDDETRKLDEWADDLKVALERDIKDMDRQIREARRAASQAVSLEAKLAGQKQLKALEAQRTAKRRSLFDAQDQIDARREQIIQDIEARMAPQVTVEPVLEIRWRLR